MSGAETSRRRDALFRLRLLPPRLRCRTCGVAALFGGQTPHPAGHDGVIDELIKIGVLREGDRRLFERLRGFEVELRMEGARKTYLHLERYTEGRALVQKYRPELYAQIVARGALTPTQ